MSCRQRARDRLAKIPRRRLATVPTPLEPGPSLDGGATLLVKRDDLTGLGMGGNKARKLEFLCGEALAAGADTLITCGADQSNFTRMTAAAAARLDLEAHLVLGGSEDCELAGNTLLSTLFGAELHRPGTDRWTELARVADQLADELRSTGRSPYVIPVGGSDAIGGLGYLEAWLELMGQCERQGVVPAAVVHATSTGGTHAGLLAGSALCAADGLPTPILHAIDVAKVSADIGAESRRLATRMLERLGLGDVDVPAELVSVDERWIGDGYADPTEAGDRAVAWAARCGALVVDRTYSGKALSALLGDELQESYGPGDAVVFWHTGGHPAVFAPGGAVLEDPDKQEEHV